MLVKKLEETQLAGVFVQLVDSSIRMSSKREPETKGGDNLVKNRPCRKHIGYIDMSHMCKLSAT